MRINNIQPTTSFGTRYGKNLTRFIENNRDILTNDNFKNLSRIRNNGIDSVLELEEASPKDKKMYNYKYYLNLTGGIIDKKNDKLRTKNTLSLQFKDYMTGEISGKPIVTDNRFPIPIKNIGDNTYILIAREFNDHRLLAERIEKEYEQAQIVEKEFPKFEQDYLKKLGIKG